MITYVGDVTLRKVLRNCWQRFLLLCAPIPNATRWTVHVIFSLFWKLPFPIRKICMIVAFSGACINMSMGMYMRLWEVC